MKRISNMFCLTKVYKINIICKESSIALDRHPSEFYLFMLDCSYAYFQDKIFVPFGFKTIISFIFLKLLDN